LIVENRQAVVTTVAQRRGYSEGTGELHILAGDTAASTAVQFMHRKPLTIHKR